MSVRSVKARDGQGGVALIEVLVTMFILLIGLLGLAGLQVQAQRSEMESYQRVQALVLLQDMAGRINANRKAATCYNITTAATGAPYFGTGSTLPIPAAATCAAASQAIYATQHAATGATLPLAAATAAATIAAADMNDWHNLLLGAAEKKGSSNLGAMIGARGCVSYDATKELPAAAPIAGTGIYTVSIAWQGLGSTFASPAGENCGIGLYGSAAQRRVVSLPLRIANLL